MIDDETQNMPIVGDTNEEWPEQGFVRSEGSPYDLHYASSSDTMRLRLRHEIDSLHRDTSIIDKYRFAARVFDSRFQDAMSLYDRANALRKNRRIE